MLQIEGSPSCVTGISCIAPITAVAGHAGIQGVCLGPDGLNVGDAPNVSRDGLDAKNAAASPGPSIWNPSAKRFIASTALSLLIRKSAWIDVASSRNI